MKLFFRRLGLSVAILMALGTSLHAHLDDFARPNELLPNIAFWTRVYGEWTTNQIALVDTDDLGMLYRVIDVPGIGGRFNGLRRDQIIKNAKDEVASSLRRLDLIRPQSELEVAGLDREIFLSLKDIQRPDKYQRADFIRAQNGLRDRFEQGYMLSGAHDREIKARLKAHGLPEELIAVAFVESLFYPTSRSSVGAAGIWQFMRGTAKEYMSINRLVDERYDPIFSTEAAIAYLKRAKEKLSEWPLAITSYNYGRAGIARAIEQTGSTNIVDILNQYKTSRFGFAARNYYAEFLAALDVYKSAPFIFQGKKPIEHWDYEVLVLPVAAYLRDLVLPQAVDQDWLQRYNPALTKEARLGREVLPAGFTLRIPPGTKDKVGARLSMLSAQEKAKAQDHVRGRHRANGKQRIFDIAKTYDVFHDQLAKRLGYAAHDKPKNGSVILLRSADSRFTELPSAVYRPGQQMVEPDKENSVAAAP